VITADQRLSIRQLMPDAMTERRARPDRDAARFEQLQVRVERNLPHPDDDADVRECGDLGVEMRQTVGDLVDCRLVGVRRARTAAAMNASRSVRPSSGWCDVGMLAKPARWSPDIRKSPEPPTPSPVNTRPVRFAPCAAGARPTRSSRARGSPKPGTGLPQ
jgi:hypothetical protein